MSVDAPVDDKRAKRARLIIVSVIAIVGILVLVLATRPATETEAASPLIGQPAPALVGTSLDGRSVDLASMKGRWVVVNFFATWCLPCRQEHPELKAFSAANPGPTDPTIVAVGFDKNDIAAARSFFASEGGDWPVVPDESGRISIGFGVRALPESFVVAPDGKIAERLSGAVTEADLNAITKRPV